MYPINPQNTIMKSIYVWDEQNGGQNFFGYAPLLWGSFFYLLSLFSIPPNYSEKILIILMFSLGFIFTYLSHRLLFKNTKYADKKLAIFAAFIFTLNPSVILMPGAYPPLFAFPVCYYFLLKFLDTVNFKYLIPFSLFLNFAYFTDFPQPKLLVVFCISVLFLIPLYTHLRNVKIISQFPKLFIATVVCLLLNAFIFLPFVRDMFGQGGYYSYLSQPGYVYGGRADLYSAIIPYISRFYNSNLVNDTTKIGLFLGNPIFITWTYFLWAIILGNALFVKEKKDKKLIYLLLIAITFFIFLAKGPNPPFERIYNLLLYNIPFFKIFRTTATVIFGGAIFYSFLLSITVYNLSLIWKRILFALLFINILIFSPIFLGYQFYRADQNNKGISIPSEYFKMGKLLDNIKENNKVLSLPLDNGYLSKTWLHSGSPLMSWITKKPLIHSSVLGGINFKQDIDTFTSQSACLFTTFYNVGYLLWEKDSNHTTIAKNINFFGEIIDDNQYFRLEKINPACLLPSILPSIYTPSHTVYYQGNSEDLFTAMDDIAKKQKPLILQSPINDSTSPIPEGVNDVVVEALPEDISLDLQGRNFVRLYLGLEGLIGDIFYPYVRNRPDSLLYPLVLLKESRTENNSNFDKRQLLDKKLFFASKRISEVEKWGINNTWWNKTLLLYTQKIEEAIEVAVSSENKKDNLELVVEYIDRHRKKIKEIIKNTSFRDKEKINGWENALNTLEEKARINYERPQFNELHYKFNPPLSGNYQIFLDNLSKGVKADVYLNGNIIASNSSQLDDLGNHYLNAGNNEIIININSFSNLLEQKKWEKIQREREVKIDPSSIVFTDEHQKESQVPPNTPAIFQEIEGWQKNKVYLLKINYQNFKEATFKVLIKEKRDIYSQQRELWEEEEKPLAGESLGAGSEFVALLEADKNAIGAKIYIYNVNGTTEVKSIELQEITIPKVYIKLDNYDLSYKQNEDLSLEFIKINPTEYKVKINHVNNPFYLVFLESFNRGWEVKINHRTKAKSSVLPENTHFIANGYANAWYITPEMLSESENYDIVINYSPQKLFYLGLLISFLTLLVCFIPFYEIHSRKK